MLEINLNKIKLVETAQGRGRMYNGIGFVDTKFDIIAEIDGKEKRIGIAETNVFDNGVKYVVNWKINPSLRGRGIGTFILKKFFRGYYLYNGNDRVKSLYERLGKPQSKFSTKENRQFLTAFSGTGLFKIK